MAIALDDSYVKAYLRRGTAKTNLGKLKEAKEGLSVDHGCMCACGGESRYFSLLQILTLC